MDLLIKTRSYVFHAALVALYALPAVAFGAVPSAADLLHFRSGHACQAQQVIVAFKNDSLPLQEMQIGEEHPVADRSSTPPSVSVGARTLACGTVISHSGGAIVPAIAEALASRQVTMP